MVGRVARVKTMRVAAVQLDVSLADVSANLVACEALARKAAAAGAEVIALPEFFTTGAAFLPELAETALAPDGVATEMLLGVAAEEEVLLGGSFLCRDADGEVRNAFFLAGPDGLLGRHDKDLPTMWENALYVGRSLSWRPSRPSGPARKNALRTSPSASRHRNDPPSRTSSSAATPSNISVATPSGARAVSASSGRNAAPVVKNSGRAITSAPAAAAFLANASQATRLALTSASDTSNWTAATRMVLTLATRPTIYSRRPIAYGRCHGGKYFRNRVEATGWFGT